MSTQKYTEMALRLEDDSKELLIILLALIIA